MKKLLNIFTIALVLFLVTLKASYVYASSSSNIIKEGFAAISKQQLQETEIELKELDSLYLVRTYELKAYIASNVREAFINTSAYGIIEYTRVGNELDKYSSELRIQVQEKIKNEKKNTREKILKEVDNTIAEKKRQVQTDLFYRISEIIASSFFK
jgi:hypothetical protein